MLQVDHAITRGQDYTSWLHHSTDQKSVKWIYISHYAITLNINSYLHIYNINIDIDAKSYYCIKKYQLPKSNIAYH